MRRTAAAPFAVLAVMAACVGADEVAAKGLPEILNAPDSQRAIAAALETTARAAAFALSSDQAEIAQVKTVLQKCFRGLAADCFMPKRAEKEMTTEAGKKAEQRLEEVIKEKAELKKALTTVASKLKILMGPHGKSLDLKLLSKSPQAAITAAAEGMAAAAEEAKAHRKAETSAASAAASAEKEKEKPDAAAAKKAEVSPNPPPPVLGGNKKVKELRHKLDEAETNKSPGAPQVKELKLKLADQNSKVPSV